MTHNNGYSIFVGKTLKSFAPSVQSPCHKMYYIQQAIFKILLYYVYVYVYSRGGPQMAPAPRPSLIYCALLMY
jgi:hypothetical protein